MEQREEGSLQKGQLLASEFEGKFSDIVVTVHPADIPGEVPGKGSNTRWAARWMAEREAMKSRSTQSGMPTPTDTDVDAVITIMDADTAFAADYFLAVAVRYLLTSPEKRKVMMFVPPLIFDRNQSDVPAFTRVTDIMWSTASASYSSVLSAHLTLFDLQWNQWNLPFIHNQDTDVCLFHVTRPGHARGLLGRRSRRNRRRHAHVLQGSF